MTLPFHRGQINTSMTYRGTNFGNKDAKIDEANRSLLEQENERRLVGNLIHLPLYNYGFLGRIRASCFDFEVGKFTSHY
jgi:hypothetical protein